MVDLIVPLNETNISSPFIVSLYLPVVLTETNILVENVDTPYNNIGINAPVIKEVSQSIGPTKVVPLKRSIRHKNSTIKNEFVVYINEDALDIRDI